MMRQEFKTLMCQLIDENYREIEQAYMCANEDVDKRTYAKNFFKQGMIWTEKLIEARATLMRYANEIERINAEIEKAKNFLDSLVEQ